MLGNPERRAQKPDAQGFDEIRIVTEPRYKTSHMSGDEWRISARVEFWRKGRKIHEIWRRDVESACHFLSADYHAAIDDGHAYFAGEGGFCDQEGCNEVATVTLKLKKQFSREGYEGDPYKYDTSPLMRKFCARHSTRGDCGLEDADSNYENITGQVVEPRTEDKRASMFGGFIKADPQEAN